MPAGYTRVLTATLSFWKPGCAFAHCAPQAAAPAPDAAPKPRKRASAATLDDSDSEEDEVAATPVALKVEAALPGKPPAKDDAEVSPGSAAAVMVDSNGAPQRKRLRKAAPATDADAAGGAEGLEDAGVGGNTADAAMEDVSEDEGDADAEADAGDEDYVVEEHSAGGGEAGGDADGGADAADEGEESSEDEDDLAPIFKRRPGTADAKAKGMATVEGDSEPADKPKAAPKKTSKASKAGKSSASGVGDFAVEVARAHAAFDPAGAAKWKAGEPVPFSFFRDTLDAIAEEPKRLRIQQLVTECLRAIALRTPEDLLPVVYLFARRLAPAHEGMEMNVGDAALIKTLSEATGTKEATIKEQYTESGDLGIVAEFSRSKQRCLFKPKPLTVRKVFAQFKQIATISGDKVTQRRRDLIKQILVASQGSEARWLMSLLQGKTRIGLAEQSVVVALAHAAALQMGPGAGEVQGEGSDEGEPCAQAARLAKAAKRKDAVALAEVLEEATLIVKKCYSEMPSYDALVKAMLAHGVWTLYDHCYFTVGVPVKPMLAKPTNGVREVLDRFDGIEFTCEYKYDGERAQIHISESGEVAIYSRNSENSTAKYPDLVSIVKRAIKPGVGACVLDGEAVAIDRTTSPPTILPFQQLMNRKRKDVEEKDIEIKACMFAFDCLYLGNESLMTTPLAERREKLYSAFNVMPGEFEFAKTHTSGDADEIARFLDESVNASTEGLIIKTLHGADAHYEPSRRSLNWLKLKKDYCDGMGDSVDLVPVAALFGKGKRAGVYGAYLLACYDEDTETYQSVCKVGTGFSEAELEELSEKLRPHVIPGPRPYYAIPDKLGGAGTPDVFFDAVQVWEVKAADLSISPVHLAAKGLVDPDKGIALRFPRFLRVREDKKPEQATSAAQIADLYRSQAVIGGGAKADDDDEEEV